MNANDKYLVHQEIVEMPIDDIKPYYRNAKLHDNMVGYLKTNIDKLRFRTPIYVDKDLVIINGHARRLAALALGMTKVPVIVASDLSEDEVKLWRLTDNRLTEMSDWDLDALGLELSDLRGAGIRVEDFGLDFDFGSIPQIDDLLPPEEESVEHADVAVPSKDEVTAEPGTMYRLGEHRLYCGPPEEGIPLLLAECGRTFDLALANPQAGKKGKVPHEVYETLFRSMKDASALSFVCTTYAENPLDVVGGFLSRHRSAVKSLAFWRKTNQAPNMRDREGTKSVDVMVAFGPGDNALYPYLNGPWDGFIEGSTDTHNPYAKAGKASFPQYIPDRLVLTFTRDGMSVLDATATTGNTLMACLDAGCTAYMCEPDPVMCTIIIRRYEQESVEPY